MQFLVHTASVLRAGANRPISYYPFGVTLAMNWKGFLNSLATAIISGAVSGLAANYADPTHLHGVGGTAAAGAAIGVVNLLRQRPHAAPAPAFPVHMAPPAAPDKK